MIWWYDYYYDTITNPGNFLFSIVSFSSCSVFVDNTPEELKIIREFYLNENSNEAQEYFESELEAALEARTKLIVIEPKQFGQATARYIYIGEFERKTSLYLAILFNLSPPPLYPQVTY